MSEIVLEVIAAIVKWTPEVSIEISILKCVDEFVFNAKSEHGWKITSRQLNRRQN
jgi:hypothetical protein